MESHENTGSWEQELADLLNDLTDVQDELLELLAEKRHRMAAADTPAMAAVQPRAEQLHERLEGCHQRRRQLLDRAQEQGLPSENLSRLATAARPTSRQRLSQQVHQNAQRMRLLQHQSLTNWVLAQRTLLHLSQLLEILASGGQLAATYGPGEPQGSRGSLVDQQI